MKIRHFHFAVLIILAWMNMNGTVSAQSKSNKTNLKGTIKNQQKDFILLRQQGRADTVKLGKDGAFQLLIEQNAGNYFNIEHGKQSIVLFLLPSDDVEITLNGGSLFEATVTGASAPYCQYLINKQKADKAVQVQYPNYRIGSLPAETFYAMRDSVKTARKNELEKSMSTSKFISAFHETEKKIYDYQMGYELLAFKTQASKLGISSFPAKIDQYIQSLSLNDEQVTYDYYFKSYALHRLAAIATEQYYAGQDKSVLHYYELQFESICKLITSDKNKSVIISEMMPQLIKDIGTADLRNIIATLEGCCNDKKLINSIKKFAEQYAYLYPGNIAPDAGFYDANGKTSHISDYRGKVVYIDTWATWCGPCKREIPFLKTLEEEYHGKNVQFISVSTDKDVKAWKDFIAKEQMGGLQLHQSDNFNESISSMYIVNSIPRFILIDEAGKIVNTDAPRPSSGEQIRNLFDTLLAD